MSLSGQYAADARLALTIADAVDKLTLAGFRDAALTVETKSDDTPVTDIDRGAEQLIRDHLKKLRPDDGVFGEEFGADGGGSRQWIIDPVDGTKNFIRGIPVWGTLIALLDDGKPVVGVVSAPALGMRWFAAKGDGAWRGRAEKDAVRMRVSAVDSVGEATLSYSSLEGWDAIGRLPQLTGLMNALWRTRAFGDFWSYMLVAEGAVEIATEPELALYDMAALVPIVEEAGGRFTSLAGEPGPFGGNALATNGLLHDDVLNVLGTR